VTLDLVTTSSRRRGSMTIRRRYAERPVQVDINLLTSQFPIVLADSIDRILTQAVATMVPGPAQPDDLIQAQAG
jgi:hypothetical protein